MGSTSQRVSRLSVTRLAVWNAGTEPIRSTDIAGRAPLRLTARDGITVLEATVLEVTRAANRLIVFTDEHSDAKLRVTFEFLDPSDGALINVIHDGIGLEDVALVGIVVGGTVRRTVADPETIPAERSASRVRIESGRRKARFGAALSILIGGPLTVLASLMGAVTLASASVLIVMIGIGLYAYARRVYPPSGLRIFDNDL
jgi:hypothetical protein